MDESKIELMPANYGRDCIGNGKHKNEEGKIIECLCDECDYMICCLIMKGFDDCSQNKIVKIIVFVFFTKIKLVL